MAEEAPVGDGVEIDEDVCVGVALHKVAGALHEGVTAGVGVGIAEDDLAVAIWSSAAKRASASAVVSARIVTGCQATTVVGWLRSIWSSCSSSACGAELAAGEVVERGRAGTVDAPRLFAHADDAVASGFGGGEVDVGHLGDGVAHGVVDGAFADFAAFDVRDGNAQGERDAGGGEHLVAVGDEQEQVGAHLRERVGEAEDGEAHRLGHAGIGVGVEEALDARGDWESVAFDLADGVAELRREMRGHDDELQVDVGMCGEFPQGPVEVAVVRARGGDDGDGALHAVTIVVTG